jgi:hypothetical protein
MMTGAKFKGRRNANRGGHRANARRGRRRILLLLFEVWLFSVFSAGVLTLCSLLAGRSASRRLAIKRRGHYFENYAVTSLERINLAAVTLKVYKIN